MMSSDRRTTEGFGGASDPHPGGFAAWTESFLRVPLFWKLLLAHLVVVTAAVATTLFLATRMSPHDAAWKVATLSWGVTLLLSTLLTALVLRLALAPLDRLERTALRELAARALESAEAERRRVALLLQDRIAQQLAGALVQLRLIETSPPGPRREAARVTARESLVGALEEVRRMARALRPPELEELGLERALTALVREVRENADRQILVELEQLDRDLPRPTGLALFRILQGAALGALGEPEATGIRIVLKSDDECVIGEVTAVGARPLPSAWPGGEAGPGGLGLFEMQERARFVGGTVEIDADSEGGCRLRVTIPTGTPPGTT